MADKDETTGTQADSLPEGQAPAGGQGTTPAPKTYDQAALDKAIKDSKAQWGREVAPIRRENETLKARHASLESELASNKALLSQIQQRMDATELEEARKDPQALDLYRQRREAREERQKLLQERAVFETERAKHSDTLREYESFRQERLVSQAATKYGVETEELTELVAGLPEERIDAIAKALSRGRKPAAAKGAKTEMTPDSGVGVGAAEPTTEQLEAMTVEQYKQWRIKGGFKT